MGKINVLKKFLFLLAFLATTSTTTAQAAPFGFAADADTYNPLGPAYIRQGYQGFNYGPYPNFSWVNDAIVNLSSQYPDRVAKAPLGAAWNNLNPDLTMTSAIAGQTFSLRSLSLNVLVSSSLTIQGWLNGEVVNKWSGTISPRADNYTDVLLGWRELDKIIITTDRNTFFITNIDAELGLAPPADMPPKNIPQ